MFLCEYGVTLKAPVLKNISMKTTNSLLMRFWSFTRHKIEVSPFSFSWFFGRVRFLDYILFFYEVHISTQEVLQLLFMYKAVFKCNKSLTSL